MKRYHELENNKYLGMSLKEKTMNLFTGGNLSLKLLPFFQVDDSLRCHANVPVTFLSFFCEKPKSLLHIHWF